MTNIQVRAVDEQLAAAAKQRAERKGKSLSAYVRELIEHDLAADDRRRRMALLLAEIERDPDRPTIPRDQTAAALAAVRERLGAG